jgi:hypothetical protein
MSRFAVNPLCLVAAIIEFRQEQLSLCTEDVRLVACDAL